jgi:hypothetical protein
MKSKIYVHWTCCLLLRTQRQEPWHHPHKLVTSGGLRLKQYCYTEGIDAHYMTVTD